MCKLNPWMHNNLTTTAYTQSFEHQKNKNLQNLKIVINRHINYIPL